MSDFTIQTMQRDQWNEVAALIHDSTNAWYQTHRDHLIFIEGPQSTMLFCEVYETLDPGCCLIAVSHSDHKIIGSCFYHPRETHFSLGIMNVHPEAFGRGVAKALLQRIIARAEAEQKPVRLVSSAMNLDSYSLYTKAGFVPRKTFQDMILEVPGKGIDATHPWLGQICDATVEDLPMMGDLEQTVAHIRREKDYRFLVESGRQATDRAADQNWHTSVLYDADQLQGWIASITHPGSHMIGPCIARDQETAIALLLNELNHRGGQTMVFLVPVDCDKIVQAAYGWGAKNCEMHVAQVYGDFQEFDGIAMPTFMPETG